MISEIKLSGYNAYKNIFQKLALLIGNEGEKHENNPERSI